MDPTIKSGRHIAAEVDLTGSQFRHACLSEVIFDDVNLEGAKFENVNLSEGRFNNINMTGVEITDVNTAGMKINGILVDDLFAAYQKQKC